VSRRLDDLSAALRPLAFEFIARLVERGVLVQVVDTLRTEAEHRANLASGASSAVRSLHLPRRLRADVPPGDADAEKSDALDVCPFEVYALHGPDKLQWDASDPAWQVVGEVAESLGLEWGGRWRKPHDPGHVQLPRRVWETRRP
jgi:hypothetical protein